MRVNTLFCIVFPKLIVPLFWRCGDLDFWKGIFGACGLPQTGAVCVGSESLT
jgi:hypothetical protein